MEDFCTRQLLIPVDVPEVSVLHTVQMRIPKFDHDGQRPYHVILGEAVFAELTIEHTRRWSHTPIGSMAGTYRYELRANSEQWVIGGQRSSIFEALVCIQLCSSLLGTH